MTSPPTRCPCAPRARAPRPLPQPRPWLCTAPPPAPGGGAGTSGDRATGGEQGAPCPLFNTERCYLQVTETGQEGERQEEGRVRVDLSQVRMRQSVIMATYMARVKL